MRVLVVRAGALGDLVLLRGVVASLREAGHEVTLLAPLGPASALVGPGPHHAQGCLAWDRTDLGALHVPDGHDTEGLADVLGRPDAAVVYSRSPILAENLARLVPRVVVQDPQPPAGRHASSWFAEVLGELGVAWTAPPVDAATGAEEQAAEGVLRELPPGFVAVHPGSGSAAKNWPADRFAALLAELAAEERWLLVEGPAEDDAAPVLRQRGNGVRAAGLGPRVLGAVLARAGLFVGNDSGVSHVAAAFGAPTLALYGPTDPAVWSPVGPRVATLRSPDERMDGLSVAAVSEAARRFPRSPAP